ncbi:anion permease, partial [Escherichia coli]|nr:anion permease [Escherichia coli]
RRDDFGLKIGKLSHRTSIKDGLGRHIGSCGPLNRNFPNSYGGMVTHYGGAAGPVIFGVGYNDIKSWWLVGAVLTILTFLVHITLGVWWWNMLIGWNML